MRATARATPSAQAGPTGHLDADFPLKSLRALDRLKQVALQPLVDPEAVQPVTPAWRRTDPRGAEFPEFAAMLRDRMPEGMPLS